MLVTLLVFLRKFGSKLLHKVSYWEKRLLHMCDRCGKQLFNRWGLFESPAMSGCTPATFPEQRDAGTALQGTACCPPVLPIFPPTPNTEGRQHVGNIYCSSAEDAPPATPNFPPLSAGSMHGPMAGATEISEEEEVFGLCVLCRVSPTNKSRAHPVVSKAGKTHKSHSLVTSLTVVLRSPYQDWEEI